MHSFSIGTASGGPLGGLLAETLGWRWSFLSQVPLLLTAYITIVFMLHLPKLPKEEDEAEAVAQTAPVATNDQARSDHPSEARTAPAHAEVRIVPLWKLLDLPGTLLLTISLLCLISGLTLISSSRLPISDSKVIACFVSFAVLTSVFLLYEGTVAKRTGAVLPMRLFNSRTVICAAGFYLTSNVAFQGFIFHMPIYFQAGRLYTSTQTGLQMLPLSVNTAISALFAGFYLRKTGRYWNVLQICNLITFSTLAIYTTFDIHTSKLKLYASIIPNGIGAASFTIVLVALTTALPHRDQASANGLIYLCRGLGSVLGLSLSGALFQDRVANELHARIRGPGSAEIIEKLRRDILFIRKLDPVTQLQARESFILAFRTVARVSTAAFACCVILSLWLPEHTLSKTQKPDSEQQPDEARAHAATSTNERQEDSPA
ncbi:Predicted transporter (major facilitator superfamily) [Ceraceosorus bombacis]|uniref:Predicted transporter (Major facilitator superfamily) n=1 Tax=Ceraceosorus bombacis TaxID=401625 RepID=A0A0P1BH44_9BASI|nr:Predicted transporter (major facilitator superfamily) [Ceraceosorus bombacis]